MEKGPQKSSGGCVQGAKSLLRVSGVFARQLIRPMVAIIGRIFMLCVGAGRLPLMREPLMRCKIAHYALHRTVYGSAPLSVRQSGCYRLKSKLSTMIEIPTTERIYPFLFFSFWPVQFTTEPTTDMPNGMATANTFGIVLVIWPSNPTCTATTSGRRNQEITPNPNAAISNKILIKFFFTFIPHSL